MAKRANGEGGKPRKRPDGRWEARYWKDGNRRSVYGASRKEASDKLTKALATLDEPPAFRPANRRTARFERSYEKDGSARTDTAT